MVFKNRKDAGQQLAEELIKYKGKKAVVFALPRGGVPIGFEIAKTLDLPLDTIAVKKLGAPFNPELAFGAIADGGIVVFDDKTTALVGISGQEIKSLINEKKKELKQAKLAYDSGSFVKNHDFDIAIIVDDGLATGLTMEAAIKSVHKTFHSKKVVAAVPVSASSSSVKIKEIVDEFFSLYDTPFFGAVGEFYKKFDQVSDREVLDFLKMAKEK